MNNQRFENQDILLATLRASIVPLSETDGCCYSVINSIQVEDYQTSPHKLLWQIVNNQYLSGRSIRYKCSTPQCMNVKHMVVRDLYPLKKDEE